MSGKYVDPWLEYRGISQKLRKRFMRRPNLSEASREFISLAKRLEEDEQCASYAALCHLAAARCQQQSSQTLHENASLKHAARLFMQVEQDAHHLGMPGLHENLASAIHCYSHAIRTHLEMKQYLMAGCVCKELAAHLIRLDRTDEACEHLQKAVRYLDSEPCSKVDALWRLAECQIDCDRPYEALATIDELWANVIKLDELVGSSGQTQQGNNNSSWRSGRLRDAEIAIVLLALHMRSQTHNMSERHAVLMAAYSRVEAPDAAIAPERGASQLDEADYLLLQSFVLGVQWRRADLADHSATQLLPRLNALHSMLMLDIVERLYTGDYDVE